MKYAVVARIGGEEEAGAAMGRAVGGEAEREPIAKIQRFDEQTVVVQAGQGEDLPEGAEAAEAEVQERAGAVAARAGDGAVGPQPHAHLHPLIPLLAANNIIKIAAPRSPPSSRACCRSRPATHSPPPPSL